MLQPALDHGESLNFNIGGYFRDHLRRTPLDTVELEADLMSSPLASARIRRAAELSVRFESDPHRKAIGSDDFQLGANIVLFALGFSLNRTRRDTARRLIRCFASQDSPMVPVAETALAQHRAELELITQAQTELVSLTPIISVMTEAREDAHFGRLGIASTGLELNRLFQDGVL